MLSVVWRLYVDSHSEVRETERARNAGICLSRPMRAGRQTYNQGAYTWGGETSGSEQKGVMQLTGVY